MGSHGPKIELISVTQERSKDKPRYGIEPFGAPRGNLNWTKGKRGFNFGKGADQIKTNPANSRELLEPNSRIDIAIKQR